MATVFQGLNIIGDNVYLIGSKDHSEHYLHLAGKDEDGNLVYKLSKGLIGAAGWTKEAGENFIRVMELENMELVQIAKVVENDGTKN